MIQFLFKVLGGYAAVLTNFSQFLLLLVFSFHLVDGVKAECRIHEEDDQQSCCNRDSHSYIEYKEL
jgi:hypothetical protein